MNASFEFSPFKDGSLDGITILEILEDLPGNMQEHGLQESLRLLKKNGLLIIYIPFNENINKTKCIHCGEITSLSGRLHKMDEKYLRSKFGISPNLVFRSVYWLPAIHMISYKPFFASLHFPL